MNPAAGGIFEGRDDPVADVDLKAVTPQVERYPAGEQQCGASDDQKNAMFRHSVPFLFNEADGRLRAQSFQPRRDEVIQSLLFEDGLDLLLHCRKRLRGFTRALDVRQVRLRVVLAHFIRRDVDGHAESGIDETQHIRLLAEYIGDVTLQESVPRELLFPLLVALEMELLSEIHDLGFRGARIRPGHACRVHLLKDQPAIDHALECLTRPRESGNGPFIGQCFKTFLLLPLAFDDRLPVHHSDDAVDLLR
jgi:hypothetical protein